MMPNKTSHVDAKYRLAPINLENPKNAHDFQIILTGAEKKVLELGPASGYISKILKERGCHVTGIEIDPILAKEAEQFVDKIIVGDIEKLNLEDVLGSEKYNVILIGDLLAYLKEPKQLLEKLHGFLAKNGYLVCSISNIAHGSIRIKLLNGEFRYRLTGLLDYGHLRFFTLDTILSMLHGSGYSMVELKRVKEDIFGVDGADLKPYTIPGELLESILRDPEATTFQYVFRAIPDHDNNNIFSEWLEEFPKNLTTSELKNKIDYYKELVETHLNIDLPQQKEINLKTQILNLQTALEDSQKILYFIQQSLPLRLYRKYDSTIGKMFPLKSKKYFDSFNRQLVTNAQLLESVR